jgi:hypothetical protein
LTPNTKIFWLFLQKALDIPASLVYCICNNKVPICKFFTPWGSATWLITGEEDGILYGYADLGMGCVEYGAIASIQEMEAIRGPFGLTIERDLYWTPKKDVNYESFSSLLNV